MKTSRKSSIILSLAVAVAVIVGGSGCGTKDFKPSKMFSLDNAWPFDDDDEPEEGIPVRIVGAWTDTVKTTPGQKAQRGFGGRLTFYGTEGDKPILVDGQLVVYAFDEAGRAPTDNKPTRRYVFPPDQMKLHMSKNDMGASYSFWLPWDEAGGPKADVSLICRFEPKGGAVITGEQTRHILPGTMPTITPGATATAPGVPEGVPMRPAQMTLEAYQAQQRVQSGVQTAAFETPIGPQIAAAAGVATAGASVPAGANAADRQMSVTSIALPNDFQVPAGVNPRPITAAARQASRTPQVQQPAPAAPYQQLQHQQFPYQQPAATMQPVMQTAQPPVTNGAAMQQMQAAPMQMQQPNQVVQRTVMAPINMQGINAPQNQGFVPPASAPQFVGQQQVMMQAAQPIMPQQQMVTAPMQQTTTMPVQQMVPQQSCQQMPSPNGVRTTVSYGPPATLPMR